MVLEIPSAEYGSQWRYFWMFYPFARSYVKCFLKGHFRDKIDIIVKRFSLKRAEFTEARLTSFFDRTNRRLTENTNE